MNLAKFEKIDGREALRRLADGEKVFGGRNDFWFMREDAGIEYVIGSSSRTAEVTLHDFSQSNHLYIPKPFDVRQAMLDRPNKWVGAYNDGVGWWAVGFDLDHCCVVSKQIPISYPVDAEYAGTDFPKPEQLNICIPIEDVPEEATR